MKYTSTRDGSVSCTFEEALCAGYAPGGGGLFVPEQLPGPITRETLYSWAKKSYPDLTFAVLRMFISKDEVPNDDLRQICESAFQGFEDPSHAVPVIKVTGGSLFIAELFHGPTFCFKDLGMRGVINLLSYFATKRQRKVCLLVATTGDTGPAAVQAVSDVNNPLLNIIVHYPHEQISDFQRKSLTTVDSPRVRVAAFEGGGDDMDAPIKNILSGISQSDAGAAAAEADGNTAAASENNVLLTGVNSYNIGRPLMQMVHFIWTYLRVMEQLGLSPAGEQQQQASKGAPPSVVVLDFVLPTGAMGNMAGGYMAKKMGIPLGKLCAGVNINDITHRAIQTGEFHRNPTMHKTLSEAINIQLPYNFERLLYYLTNGNHDLVRAWMTEVDTERKVDLSRDWLDCLQRDFNSARITDEELCATIRDHHHAHDYLVDPNTAVALSAAKKLGYTTNTAMDGGGAASSSSAQIRPVAVLATASPCKFQEVVTLAIGTENWNKYLQNGFPEAAKRIHERPEIPFVIYRKVQSSDGSDETRLAESQIVWEQTARSIVAELIHRKEDT